MNNPNVILLTIDTLRADRLGCYGNSPTVTPNLDRLAAEGISFTQAITGGSWTQAAFPVILTSSYAAMYGGCLGYLSPERPSPIQALAENGYTTGGFSTNPHLNKAAGYDRGFDHFTDLVPTEVDPRLRRIKGGQRLLRNPLIHYALHAVGQRMRPPRVYNSASEVTDSLYQWLDNIQQPFFAWAHYMDVHWPYHLEGNLVHPTDIVQAWRDVALMHERANFNRKQPLSIAQQDHFVRLYEQSLQYLDAQIGRLLSYLDKSGHNSNTVIIIVSDHGEEFFDHGRWGHWESNLFDEIVKVPFIIRLPGWKSGRVIHRQVRLLDLMPTILDICGCSMPDGIEGISMTPLWAQNGTQYEVTEAISEMQRPPWHRIAVRTEAFKYIWDNKHPDQPNLYDLRADLGETQNVCELYPEEVSRFQRRIDAHLRHIIETEPATTVSKLEHDEEILRRLQDLGYIE